MTLTLPCVDKFTEWKHQGPSEAKGLILLTEGGRIGDDSHGPEVWRESSCGLDSDWWWGVGDADERGKQGIQTRAWRHRIACYLGEPKTAGWLWPVPSEQRRGAAQEAWQDAPHLLIPANSRTAALGARLPTSQTNQKPYFHQPLCITALQMVVLQNLWFLYSSVTLLVLL